MNLTSPAQPGKVTERGTPTRAVGLVLGLVVAAALSLAEAAFTVVIGLAIMPVGSARPLGALVAAGSAPSCRILGTSRSGDRGRLLGGLVAATSRPDVATAPLDAALLTIRARATPRTAPSSAPVTTKSWPNRRRDRSTGPPYGR